MLRIGFRPNHHKNQYFLLQDRAEGPGQEVFFQALSELDAIMKNNLLSINTISGSGTGAQFYLSTKFSLRDKYQDVFNQTATIKRANMILYQQDYISSALFKILFTDYIRSKFIRHPSPSSRNYELMKLESEQYDHLVDSFNFKAQQIDSLKYLNSDWGQVYNPTKMKNNKFPLFSLYLIMYPMA